MSVQNCAPLLNSLPELFVSKFPTKEKFASRPLNFIASELS